MESVRQRKFDILHHTKEKENPAKPRPTAMVKIQLMQSIREGAADMAISGGRFLSRLAAIKTWTSIFIMAIGILVIIFGLILSFIFYREWQNSLVIALAGILGGSLIIGVSKIIEAAEIYIAHNRQG